MLDSIIRFSLKNRLTIIVAAILITIAGIYTAKTMEVDVFPDLNAPTVVVMTEAKGMAPEEVERIVSFPIETAVNGSTGVRRVRSTSTTGFSCVWVEFDWGMDIYRARQIVNEKLAEVSSSLPASVGQPTLGPQSSILGEVMIVGLTADSTSQQSLRTYADWTLRPRLLSVGGVAQVSVQGGEEKEYQVLLHPERMRHHNVSISEAVDAVRDINQNVSGGVLYEHGNEYIIRGALATSNCDELGQTVVKSVDGVPVLLSQIADVQIGNKTPKVGLASNNARPAVLLTIAKQPNVSTEELTANLDRAIESLRTQLPKDVTIDTQIFRQERFIDASISNIKESLLEGALFVVVVLFIFLMNARTTIISLITIPLSLLVSILTLKCFGLTINTMSIGGMAIAIGSLVDDAIVDVENVYKRLRHPTHSPLPASPGGGEDTTTSPVLNTPPAPTSTSFHSATSCRTTPTSPQGAWEGALSTIFHASREVRLPILNSTLIVIVSFLPLFFLTGMEGRMLIPLGVAFIVSLFASTVVALTLTPVLCSYLLTGRSLKDASEPRFVLWLKNGYTRALQWTLAHSRIVIGSTLACFAVTIVIFFSLGRSFLPSFNEGSFTISLSTLPGISLDESDKIGRQAEQLLMDIPEIKTVARKTGRAELDEHAFGVNTSEIEAPFELTDRTREELQHDVRERLATLPGVAIEIGQPISHRIDAMLSGTRANIAIKLFGTDLNRMYKLGNEIKAEIGTIPGVTDLNVEQQVERPQLRITPRRSLMAKYGVTPKQFADYVSVCLEGETVSQVYEGNSAFDLTVKVDDEDRNGMQHIHDLMIDANGTKIPLEYIADIQSSSGPNTINRENAQRKIVISCNVEGRDLRSTVNDIQQRIASDIQLPKDYHIEYGGQFESEESASQSLMLLSLVAVLIIYLLIYNQFKSFRQAGIIMLNLPLALIGGVIAIAITGGELSIPAIIGFISLFGIATRNGILLVDRYNQAPEHTDDSIIAASLDRLSPILMTALTSALALIPLALGGDLPGNEIQSPMAKVILGGLVTSTILNGFIIPIMYKATTTQNPQSPREGVPSFHSATSCRTTPTSPHGDRKASTSFHSATSCRTAPTSPRGGWKGAFALFLSLFTLHFPPSSAQTALLSTIEQNNTTLAALRLSADADKLENRTDIYLSDPEIGFNYLWGNPSAIGSRKDYSITQSLDVATLTGSRSRLADIKDLSVEWQYLIDRQAILLEARQLLVDAVYYNAVLAEQQRRQQTADKLVTMTRKRLDAGDANILEYRNAKLSSDLLNADILVTIAQRDAVLADLSRLNGGKPLSITATTYDDTTTLPLSFDEWFAVAAEKNPVLQYVRNAVDISRQQLTISKQQGLPTLSVGYMGEKTMGELYHGISLGISVPLWSNKNRVRQARAAVTAAEQRAVDARQQFYGQLQTQYQRTIGLRQSADAMRRTLTDSDNTLLLQKALQSGELSVIDYLQQLSQYYDAIDKSLSADHEYQKALTDLMSVTE